MPPDEPAGCGVTVPVSEPAYCEPDTQNWLCPSVDTTDVKIAGASKASVRAMDVSKLALP